MHGGVFLACALAVGAHPTPAGDSAGKVIDEDTCRVDGQDVALRLRSPSGHEDEGDETLLIVAGGKEIPANIGGKTARYYLAPRWEGWKGSALCRKAEALVDGRRALFLLAREGTVDADGVAVLYDYARGVVLDTTVLGPEPRILSREHGVTVLLRQSIDAFGGRCAASCQTEDGDRVIRFEDRALQRVVQLTISGDKLAVALDLAATNSGLPAPYPTSEEFARSFGWQPAAGRLGEWAFSLGTTARGRTCIRPGREGGHGKWQCTSAH